MTDREKTRDDRAGATKTAVYDTPDRKVTTKTTNYVDTDIAKPTDLVRWGPVLAGLFAALATLATLSILGIALSLSAYDVNNPGRAFGIGAGIWGAITALVSFLIGGWVAGRSAAHNGQVNDANNGIMNGAMVWFVAIPLLIYALGSGIGALANTAGNIAGTAASVAGDVAAGAADNTALQATAAAAGDNPALQATAQALGNAVTDPTNVQQAADVAGTTAWGTLLSLGLAAAAAIGGGYLGARQREETVTMTRA